MATNLNLFDNWRKTVANPTRAAAIAGTLKMALFKTFSPSQNTDDFYNDLTAGTNEVTGSNYSAGGNALASPTWTGPDGSGVLTFDADDPATWAQHASGFTNARRVIIYYDTAVASTSTLVAYSDDFGADVGNTAADVVITLNASGIYTSPR